MKTTVLNFVFLFDW